MDVETENGDAELQAGDRSSVSSNESVQVGAVRNVKREMLLELTSKTVKRGSLVCTGRLQSHTCLVSCGFRHKRIHKGKRFAEGRPAST